MNAIKDFFRKKKVDSKFKAAGTGHKLTTQTSQNPSPPSQGSLSKAGKSSSVTSSSSYSSSGKTHAQISAQSIEARRNAAAAACARLEQKMKATNVNWSLKALRAQAQRELQSENTILARETISTPHEAPTTTTPVLAVSGVFFKCPLTGPEILPRAAMETQIHEFLYEQLQYEPGLTAALIIHSCNKNKEKITACVNTLCRYLENIIQNPTEEKFHKIRISNKVYQEKVFPIEGSREFLLGTGFEVKTLPQGDGEEEFLVFSQERADDVEMLQSMYDALLSAEPIVPELDRNLTVLLPSQAAKKMDLPPDFFNVTPEELKREQQQREEFMERQLMLRTKAMKERDEQRERNKYRYTLIRIRFPDGIILQGTFRTYERLHSVREFVHENLLEDWQPFLLHSAAGEDLHEDDSLLIDLHLVPAAVIHFQWDPSIAEDIKIHQTHGEENMYLKPETMALLQPL